MLSDVLFKVGFTTAIIIVPALVGLVIGFIALVKISGYQRKHKEIVQVNDGQQDQIDTLALTFPWLNNGFVSGLFMGCAIGIGLTAPYMVLNIIGFFSLVSGATTTFFCISTVLGVLLAFLFGHLTKKAIFRIGLNPIGLPNKGIGRILMAILGVIIGFMTGWFCTSIFLFPFVAIR